MDLTNLLPYVYAGGSEIVDNLGTCYNCSINSIEQEANPSLKKSMEEKGIVKGCLGLLPGHTALMIGVTALTSGVDYALGISQEDINFTKTWVYGFGSFKYLCGMIHIVYGTVGAARLGLEALVKRTKVTF